MLSKALEMSVCFHVGPVLGNVGESSFPRAFEWRVKIYFYQENLCEELGIQVKEDSGKWQLSL